MKVPMAVMMGLLTEATMTSEFVISRQQRDSERERECWSLMTLQKYDVEWDGKLEKRVLKQIAEKRCDCVGALMLI